MVGNDLIVQQVNQNETHETDSINNDNSTASSSSSLQPAPFILLQTVICQHYIHTKSLLKYLGVLFENHLTFADHYKGLHNKYLSLCRFVLRKYEVQNIDRREKLKCKIFSNHIHVCLLDLYLQNVSICAT